MKIKSNFYLSLFCLTSLVGSLGIIIFTPAKAVNSPLELVKHLIYFKKEEIIIVILNTKRRSPLGKKL